MDLRSTGATVLRTLGHHRRARRLLRTHRFRPGLYRYREGIWVNTDANQDPELMRTKGRRRPRPSLGGALDRLAAQPVRNRDGDMSGATTLLHKGYESLLFAPADGRVERLSARPRFTSEFTYLRTRMSRHIPAPSFEVTDEGRRLIESWLPGHVVNGLSMDEQVDCAQALLADYASLVQAEATGSSGDFAARAMRALRGAAIPAALRDVLAEPLFGEFIGTGPLSPSHGEPGANNLMRSEGVTHLIDWEPEYLAWRPFWHDPSYLVAIWDYRPLAAGAFDAALARIWQAADLPPPDLARQRHLVAAAGAVATATARWTAGATTPSTVQDARSGEVTQQQPDPTPVSAARTAKIEQRWHWWETASA